MNQQHSRRAFTFALTVLIACLGLFGLASAADSQQPIAPRRIGVLLAASLPEEKVPQAFRQGLLDAGYAEGRDVVIEWRSANGDYNRLPQLAADLVQSRVDVIVVGSTAAAQVAKRATSTIPIVLAIVADPIARGLVASFAHPDGNITGLSAMTEDLSAKRLQLLKEAIPRVARVAVLWNPDAPWHAKVIEQLKAAAPSLSIKLNFVPARTPEEFDAAFSAMRQAHAQALYVIEDAFFFGNRMTLLKLASKARLPIIYWVKEFAEGGGLMSYGASYGDLMRRSAGYVDKILKGAKPGDLPIEQPTKFELVVNLKTAKALGITIPQSILVRADEVIR
ncbi:MAG: ABC transporter substrate-binding protein [Betaproteobacteria bacterium]|nr:ABC transporter substrate-binding protein [Betaproteobacteria bacterium]